LKLLDRKARHRVMADYLEGQSFNILEAGCGRKWPYPKGDHTITGIDMDPDALDYRQRERKDLDHTMLGDLRTTALKPSTYDVIYCAFVLEHLDGAQAVLDKFVKALKPGGLLMLTFPDRDGVYGFFTRITPFWFHVFYKRHIERIKTAGKPGFGPYETFHNKVISRRLFREYATTNGLQVREEFCFGNVPSAAVRAFIKVVGLLSNLASGHVNLGYVLQKEKP
jgi:SAM-dependent methyltransferase